MSFLSLLQITFVHFLFLSYSLCYTRTHTHTCQCFQRYAMLLSCFYMHYCIILEHILLLFQINFSFSSVSRAQSDILRKSYMFSSPSFCCELCFVYYGKPLVELNWPAYLLIFSTNSLLLKSVVISVQHLTEYRTSSRQTDEFYLMCLFIESLGYYFKGSLKLLSVWALESGRAKFPSWLFHPCYPAFLPEFPHRSCGDRQTKLCMALLWNSLNEG